MFLAIFFVVFSTRLPLFCGRHSTLLAYLLGRHSFANMHLSNCPRNNKDDGDGDAILSSFAKIGDHLELQTYRESVWMGGMSWIWTDAQPDTDYTH